MAVRIPSCTVRVVACALLGFLVQLAAPNAAFAQAGPPLRTDDPGTPGDGRWEINLAFTAERRASETLVEAPILDLNHGLGDRIQLKYEVPWLVFDEEGAGARSGLGKSEVGLKWRFLDEDRDGVSMSVYPQLAFDNPTSSDERGLVDEGLAFSLPVQVSRTVGPPKWTCELGYEFVEAQKDEWLYGLAVSWPVVDGFEIKGDIYGNATRGFEEDELGFNLGGSVVWSDNVSVLFSAGRSFRGSASGEPELTAYFGIQWTF